MLRIAGRTAGPIGLNFFWTLMGGEGCYRLKNSGPSASLLYLSQPRN